MAINIDPLSRFAAVRSEAGQLRFVQRGEKRILQQLWKIITAYEDGTTDCEQDWRDVPLVEEDVGHPSFKDYSSKEMVYPEQD